MPGFDGTGPNGMGQMTGRGMGPCAGGMRRGFGCGFGRGRGFGRGFGMRMGFSQLVQTPLTKEEEKKLLQDEVKQLEAYLKELKKRLE